MKIITIVLFIVVGIFVNLGANRENEFIGFKNWSIPGAPFVGGFGGFVRVFVTASFACRFGSRTCCASGKYKYFLPRSQMAGQNL